MLLRRAPGEATRDADVSMPLDPIVEGAPMASSQGERAGHGFSAGLQTVGAAAGASSSGMRGRSTSASSNVSVAASEASSRGSAPRASERKLADELNLLRMDELKRMFFEADEDGNGQLDLEEFVSTIGSVLAGPSATREKLTVLFRRMDANMDNVVDWDEFSDFMLLEGLSKDNAEQAQHSYVSADSMAHPQQAQHATALRSVVFSHELRRYYTASADSTIRVWNEGMQHVRTVELSKASSNNAASGFGWVNNLAVSVGASQLVAATTRNLVFFDLASMEKITELHCHSHEKPVAAGVVEMTPLDVPLSSVLCVDAFTYKGMNWVAFGDDSGGIHLINPPDNSPGHKTKWNKYTAPYWSTKRHKDWVSKIEYVDKLGCLVSCSNDGTIKFTDASNGFRVSQRSDRETLPVKTTINEDGVAHSRGVRSFVWCNGYKCLATCGIERYVTLWNPYGTEQGRLGPSNSSIHDVGVNDARNQLLTVNADDTVKVWDLTSSKCIQVIDPFYIPSAVGSAPKREKEQKPDRMSGHGRPEKVNKITTMYCNPENETVLLGTKAACIWQVKSAMIAKQETSHNTEVSGVAFNLTMRQIISCDIGSTLSVWDLDTGDLSWSVEKAHGNNKISAMCIEESGACLLTGGHEGQVKMWNLSNGTFVKEFIKSKKGGEVTQLQYYTQGGFSYVCAVGWDRMVTIWADDKVYTAHSEADHAIRPLHTLAGHVDDIRCLALGPSKGSDGQPGPAANLLATGSDDGEIRIWNVELSCWKWTLFDPDHDFTPFELRGVEKMAFLAVSGVLATCGADGFLRFWAAFDAKDQLLYRQSSKHRPGESVLSMAASKDGDQLVTADSGGYVKVWDVMVFNRVQTNRSRTPMSESFHAGRGAVTVLHFKAHDGMGTAAMFVELELVGKYLGAKRRTAKQTQGFGSRKMSSAGMQLGGFILTASSTGEVSLWVRDTSKKAAAGALIGRFKKNSRWNLNSTSTFESRVCLNAVRDAEVARKAEWEARSDYPKTGQSVDAFLPSQQNDIDLPVDGMDSKATLRGLIRGKSRNRGEVGSGSSHTLGSTQFSSSTTSFGTTGTGFTTTATSGNAALLIPRPPTSGSRVQPLAEGVSSARSYMERTPQLPPYPLPRMRPPFGTPGSGPGKTPRYRVHLVTQTPATAVSLGRPKTSSGLDLHRKSIRAKQLLEAAGLPSLESLLQQRQEAAQYANGVNVVAGASNSAGLGSRTGSPRAGGGGRAAQMTMGSPIGRGAASGTGTDRPWEKAGIEAAMTPRAALRPNTVSGDASRMHSSTGQQSLPQPQPVPLANTPAGPDATKASGLGFGARSTPLSARTGPGARDGTQRLKSGDSVFKYKRLPISEANYEVLMDERKTPKIRRSSKVDAIFKDQNNLRTLTSNRQNRSIRS